MTRERRRGVAVEREACRGGGGRGDEGEPDGECGTLAAAGDRSQQMTSVLRDEWGFDGTVVSDYFAVRQVESYHHVVSTVADAAATALRAGIDVELPATDCFGAPLGEALASGAAVIEDVDRAVARVLTSKFRLGLFERPYVDVGSVPEHIRTPAQLELARRIAQDSIVLLANDGVLPLDAATGPTIALIGWRADQPEIQGGGSAQVTPPYVVTPLQGVKERAGAASVTFASGRVTPRSVPITGRLLAAADDGPAGGGAAMERRREPDPPDLDDVQKAAWKLFGGQWIPVKEEWRRELRPRGQRGQDAETA